MSVFVRRVKNLSNTFQLSTLDQIKIFAHYPLFKMAWHAAYGTKWKNKISSWAMSAFSKYTTTFQAFGQSGAHSPVTISFKWSDLCTFEEIFFEQEYELPADLTQSKTYVDLGGNVGMAALFFLLKCNLNHLVIVEANPLILPQIKFNLKGSADRKIEIVNGYISGTQEGEVDFLISSNDRMSTAAELATEQNDGKIYKIRRVPLAKLLQQQGLIEVDILKMDIEGGEYSLMKEDPQVFRRFKAIFAELHGDQSTRNQFIHSLKELGFKISHIKKESDVTSNVFARRTI